MITLSGTEFNNKYPNTEFYKVLTKDYKHYGFTYQHGLNVDKLNEQIAKMMNHTQ